VDLGCNYGFWSVLILLSCSNQGRLKFSRKKKGADSRPKLWCNKEKVEADLRPAFWLWFSCVDLKKSRNAKLINEITV